MTSTLAAVDPGLGAILAAIITTVAAVGMGYAQLRTQTRLRDVESKTVSNAERAETAHGRAVEAKETAETAKVDATVARATVEQAVSTAVQPQMLIGALLKVIGSMQAELAALQAKYDRLYRLLEERYPDLLADGGSETP